MALNPGHTYQASSVDPVVRIRILKPGWRGSQFTEGAARGVEVLYLGDPAIEVVGGLILVSKPSGSAKSVLAAIRATNGVKTLNGIMGHIGPVAAAGLRCRATAAATVAAILPGFELRRGDPCMVLVARIQGRTVIAWIDAGPPYLGRVSRQAGEILERLRFL